MHTPHTNLACHSADTTHLKAEVEIAPLTGDALRAALPTLARLRIAVFQEWPYLYQGSLDYEQDYLNNLGKSPKALLVVARHNDEIVGAATASPLQGHADDFSLPFLKAGLDTTRIFYFGEFVLLPAYRGQGIGRSFLNHAEDFVLQSGAFDSITLCTITRPANDPRQPVDYASLDPLWRKRGFTPMPAITIDMEWREVDGNMKMHTLQFWQKELQARTPSY